MCTHGLFGVGCFFLGERACVLFLRLVGSKNMMLELVVRTIRM
jgi:hypothetical protein